jgi:hypothetical protein
LTAASEAGGELETLFGELLGMPTFLEQRFGSLPPELVTAPDALGGFSPVEHCWHLADLEREGFGVRITRLRQEDQPDLPDFDGARIAAERRYREKSLPPAITAFWEARLANLAALRSLDDSDWSRWGVQQGVGRVAIRDLPRLMVEHDRQHRKEIDAWFQGRA